MNMISTVTAVFEKNAARVPDTEKIRQNDPWLVGQPSVLKLDDDWELYCVYCLTSTKRSTEVDFLIGRIDPSDIRLVKRDLYIRHKAAPGTAMCHMVTNLNGIYYDRDLAWTTAEPSLKKKIYEMCLKLL